MIEPIAVLVNSKLEAKTFYQKRLRESIHHIHDDLIVAIVPKTKEAIDNTCDQLAEMGVKGFVSWGFAGGLSDEVKPGSLIIPDRIIHPFGPTLETSQALKQQVLLSLPGHLPCLHESLAHSDHVCHTRQDKTRLHERTGAVGVDQESYLILNCARALNLPMISVRVILDDLDTELPLDIEALQGPNGSLNLFEVAKRCFRPSQWSVYYKLNQQYATSSKVLSQAKTLISPQPRA